MNPIIQEIYSTLRVQKMYQVPRDNFYINNMTKILEELKNLFPNSSVRHTLLATAMDGNLYDISKINDSILPLLVKALDDSYIIID